MLALYQPHRLRREPPGKGEERSETAHHQDIQVLQRSKIRGEVLGRDRALPSRTATTRSTPSASMCSCAQRHPRFGNWFSPFNRRQVFVALLAILNAMSVAVFSDIDISVFTVSLPSV